MLLCRTPASSILAFINCAATRSPTDSSFASFSFLQDGGHQVGKVYSMVAARIACGAPCAKAPGQDVVTVPASNQCYPQYIVSFTHG